MNNENLLSIFKNPLQWRDLCYELDSKYSDNVFDSTNIEISSQSHTIKTPKGEFDCQHSSIESFDKITGFYPILKEYSKKRTNESTRNSSITPDALRSIFLKKTPPQKIRILSFDNDGVVGMTQANHSILRPTTISQWVSIMAKQRELFVEPSFSSKFFSPYQFSAGLSTDSNLGLTFDDLQYKVGFNYNPNLEKKMNLNSFILRQICSNGSTVIDKGWEWSVPYNHDNGAWRAKAEKLISNQLFEKNKIKIWIEDLNDKKIFDVEEHAKTWGPWNKISDDIKKAIVIEYNECNLNESAYDFFNAITSARHRIENVDPDSIHHDLAPLAGLYLENQVGFTQARHSLNELLKEVI